MAAIDKMYVNSYFDYDDLRLWAIIYYPKLLRYFYDITTTWPEWEKNRKAYVEHQRSIAETEYNKLKEFGDINDKNTIVCKRIQYYKEQGIELSIDSVSRNFDYIINIYNKSTEDWEESYSYPIMNTPFGVDRKLLWICPLPCVRKYLKEHCGYKTRWYHKLFWRGRKMFK